MFELWEHCVPLEEAAPEAFLAKPALVQRLRRQIEWLCNVLKNDARTEENNPLCPLNVPWDCEHTPCEECWEQASLKAVKDEVKVK